MRYNVCLKQQERRLIFLSTKKLAVIGGGASGICSAIEAKYRDNTIDVTVFERLPKVAKKILATGNGRCNFTNENLSPVHFHGDTFFLRKVLTSSYADTENYFRSLGLISYSEDGRIYPRSQQAASLRDILIQKLNESDVTVKTETPVTDIQTVKSGFKVNGEYFDAVIVSGGGNAAAVHGSDGSCYKLLEKLGHTKTPLYPALCGLTVSDKNLNILKGVRAEAKASLYCGNELLGEESGEIQFTDKAISGIPVMNLSHLCKNNKDLSLSIDLCEEISQNELREHFKIIKNSAPERDIETVLSGVVNTKIGFAAMNKSGIKPHTKIGKLSPALAEMLCNVLKNFTFTVTGTKGFDNAQITCGGIKTTEISPDTMMSNIISGLFICGEIVDIHGDCGGYNLHLAWTTGRIAGNAAAEYIINKG